MSDEVRARYRSGRFGLVLLLGAGLSVALPFIAVGFVEWPWWQRLLLPVIAVPAMWWFLLRQLVYRLDLTGSELRLRAVLGAWRVPLTELAAFGGWAGQNVVRMTRRDGKSWTVLSGSGLVDFADELGRTAPATRIEVTATERLADRSTKFFEGKRPRP